MSAIGRKPPAEGPCAGIAAAAGGWPPRSRSGPAQQATGSPRQRPEPLPDTRNPPHRPAPGHAPGGGRAPPRHDAFPPPAGSTPSPALPAPPPAWRRSKGEREGREGGARACCSGEGWRGQQDGPLPFPAHTRSCRAASSEVEMRPSRHHPGGTPPTLPRLRSRLRSNSARDERGESGAGVRRMQASWSDPKPNHPVANPPPPR